MENVIDAFEAERQAASAVLHTVSPAGFDSLTNCPPWTLAELVIHMAGSWRTTELADVPGGVRLQAADYYRRPERATAEYHEQNAARVQRYGQSVLSRTSAVDYFDDVTGAFARMLRQADPNRYVEISGVGSMPLPDWATTRIIALTAHGLDAAMTLKRPPWTSAAALRVVRPVLESLLGASPPTALGWDDQAFLAVATGRRMLTGAERATLGPLQQRFPLLS